jgi:hypothetical protein
MRRRPTTLLNVMVDSNTPASVKVCAADSVLSHAVRATENEAAEARVQAADVVTCSPAEGPMDQGIVLEVVKDMVLCHRERLGVPTKVYAAALRPRSPTRRSDSCRAAAAFPPKRFNLRESGRHSVEADSISASVSDLFNV